MTAPRIRAGDADRQKSVDRLAKNFAEGRLTSYEYDERVQQAYASVYLDEFAALFLDLPPEPVSIEAIESAWQRGYGPPGQRRFSGAPQRRPEFHRIPRPARILAVVFLALVMISMVAISHGLFFPFPLLWIGLFGLSSARRGHWAGPGQRR